MSTLKDKLAETKKFVQNNSDLIITAISVVGSTIALVATVKLYKKAEVTTGKWSVCITDEHRDLMAIEGAKFSTHIMIGKKPLWEIIVPNES